MLDFDEFSGEVARSLRCLIPGCFSVRRVGRDGTVGLVVQKSGTNITPYLRVDTCYAEYPMGKGLSRIIGDLMLQVRRILK